MPPSKPLKHLLYMEKMNSLSSKIPQGRVKFKLGYFVRITKEKAKFAKGMNKTFPQKYFRSSRLFSAFPNLSTNSHTYRLAQSTKVLQLRACQGHSIPKQFKIDKIVSTRNKNGIQQHFCQVERIRRNF
jgi:hypothetical protein